jgi:site-specific recombinase XerC
VGLSARTLRRRLSSVSGLFGYLHARGDVTVNPVPRGLPTRREKHRPHQGVPLVRTSRTLPRILSPVEVDALMAALGTHRDRAMVAAMVLGGLRRCEVLGPRLEDLHGAERRVFVAEGEGGHQRLVPVSGRFFAAVADYLDRERPAGAATDRVFVVLKGETLRAGAHRGGSPRDPRRRPPPGGLDHGGCHELRRSRPRPGHASIESTRIYLHPADDWLAAQYRRAADAIDAQVLVDLPPVSGGPR